MQRHTPIGLISFAVLTLSSLCTTFAQAPPSASELEKLGLELRWEGQATLDVTRDVVRHIINDEQNVYVQSTAGMLTVLNAENGRQLWRRQVGQYDSPARRSVSNSEIVVVASGAELIGMDKFTGEEKFRHRLPTQIAARPGIDEKRIYVPLLGGAVYVYSLGTLEYLTRYDTLPPGIARAHLYKFVCGETIYHPPIVGEKAIAFVSEAGSFYSVETEGGSPGGTRFQLVMSGPASHDLAIAEGDKGPVALVLTDDNQVFQIDMTTGTSQWSFPIGRKMTQAPIAVGSGVYVVSRDNMVTKLNSDRRMGALGRPSAIPNFASPNVIGVGLKEIQLDPTVKDLVTIQSDTGVEITEVAPGSPAEAAGLQVEDIVVVADDLETSSVQAAQGIFAELPMNAPRRLLVIRNGQLLRLKIRIVTREWEAAPIETLLTIGRFHVYGYDRASRLVAFDRKTANPIGKTSPTGFLKPVVNSVTDQIYIANSNGHVICLREIGPEVTVPEVSAETRFVKVTKMHVIVGDGIKSSGTPICDLEAADGSTLTINSTHAGVVQRVMVREGDTVEAGDSVLRIADDQFALYHQRPQQQPVDVDLGIEAEADSQ